MGKVQNHPFLLTRSLIAKEGILDGLIKMINLEGSKIDLYMTPEEVFGSPSGELRNKADL